jgi:hypothetical protein
MFYTVKAETDAAEAKLYAMLQAPAGYQLYTSSFGAQLIVAENAREDGLRISSVAVSGLSVTGGTGDSVQWEYRKLTMYTCLTGWAQGADKSSILAWARQAETPLTVAFQKLLLSVTVPSIVNVTEEGPRLLVLALDGYYGNISVTDSQAEIPFVFITKVPTLDNTSDPDGQLFQARVKAYANAVSSLNTSTEFESLLKAELDAGAVVDLPGRSYSSLTCSVTASGFGGSAASGAVIGVIITILVVLAACAYCIGNRKKIQKRLQSTAENPTLRRMVTPMEILGTKGQTTTLIIQDDTVKPMDGQDALVDDGQSDWWRIKDDDGNENDRKKYVKQKTQEALGGALNEFDQPQNPGSPTGSTSIWGSMIGGGMFAVQDMNDMLKKRARKARTLTGKTLVDDDADHKRRHKYLGRSDTDPQLAQDAKALRMAMGGEHHHRPNHHQKSGGGRSQALTEFSSYSQDEPGSPNGSPSSRRMVEAFRELGQPVQSPTGGGHTPQMLVGKPDESNSSSSSESNSDMELVEVTDDDSADEAPDKVADKP